MYCFPPNYQTCSPLLVHSHCWIRSPIERRPCSVSERTAYQGACMYVHGECIRQRNVLQPRNAMLMFQLLLCQWSFSRLVIEVSEALRLLNDGISWFGTWLSTPYGSFVFISLVTYIHTYRLVLVQVSGQQPLGPNSCVRKHHPRIELQTLGGPAPLRGWWSHPYSWCILLGMSYVLILRSAKSINSRCLATLQAT